MAFERPQKVLEATSQNNPVITKFIGRQIMCSFPINFIAVRGRQEHERIVQNLKDALHKVSGAW